MLCALKFKQKLLYAKLFGELMAEQLAFYYQNHTKPQLLIPVPLSIQRLRERGLNQALELAKPIARKLAIKLSRDDCVRVKNTVAQSSLTFKERKRNLKGAFALRKPLSVYHVAVVDDVLTTGSTVMELCSTLRACGITKIDVWCCARVIYAANR